MKFFLDTANLKEIKEAIEIGLLDGITTNPSLIAKESIFNREQIENHYISICKLLKEKEQNISIEVIGKTFNDIIKEGQKLSLLHPKIIVKIPMNKEGIKALNFFYSQKIKTNCTLIFSVGQALLAAKLGANYISPFIGRLDDISYNGIELVKEIKNIYEKYNFNTKILAASIRNPIHIIECAKIGVHAITSPLKVIYSLLDHPLTKIGLKKFLNDFNQKFL
ncbi:fructose-6-phosphate aldolase [Blattabacterium cuenoti]|uniref:fructose-6-phosphate aldolase n=1 Tax=Blattabacterium cuenoti TaxID=1653831 RepID=UPI00163B8915|nr:fructose-6-phosphate aldolase [Blattabacterium cuenoti]